MVNRNIQMKKKNNDIWENLYPLTLNENVYNNGGLNLNDQLHDMNNVIDQKLDNLADEQEQTNININNLEEDMNNTFDYYDRLKDEKYLDVKNNPYYNAIGDGESHKIRDIFPDVTLTDVKKLNTNATLDNEADWFTIQFLIEKSIETGKEVLLSAGDYQIDLPLMFDQYFKISGSGIHSILRSKISNGYVLRHKDLTSETGRSDFISIKDFTIYGSAHVGTGGGIHFRHGGHGSVIQNIWVKYFSKKNQVGIQLSRTWYLYIQNCDISNNYNGIIFGIDSDETHVNSVVLRDSKIYGILSFDPKTYGNVGITINGGSGNLISGCQIEGWVYGLVNNEAANGTVVENCYYEDITFRQNSNYGNMFRLINSVFIHIASNSSTTYLFTSSSAIGTIYENLLFRNVPVISLLFDDKGSKESIYNNLQAEGDFYSSWITTEEIYDNLPANVTGIGFKKDSTAGFLHYNKEVAFDKGIILPIRTNSPTIKNTFYVNTNDELMFYDGTTYKKVSLE